MILSPQAFTPAWGRAILKWYNAGGPDALADGRRANGAAPKLTPAQQAELLAAVRQPAVPLPFKLLDQRRFVPEPINHFRNHRPANRDEDRVGVGGRLRLTGQEPDLEPLDGIDERLKRDDGHLPHPGEWELVLKTWPVTP